MLKEKREGKGKEEEEKGRYFSINKEIMKFTVLNFFHILLKSFHINVYIKL